MYKKPNKDFWQGRADLLDGDAGHRWHQVVQMLEIGPDLEKVTKGISIVLLGFCCDEGVRRNHGRVGAAKGPDQIRKALANMAVHFDEHKYTLYDGGDVICDNSDLEKAQRLLSSKVNLLLSNGYRPILLGGGHEIAYGHFLGVNEYVAQKLSSVGIINIDAHFDLRNYEQSGHSGTPFLQVAQHLADNDTQFYYLTLGIDESANTKALFATARSLGANWVTNQDLLIGDISHARQAIHRLLHVVDTVYVTLDMDVFQAAYAPGVSATTAMGLDPSIVINLLTEIYATSQVISFDVAELNPDYDIDGRTARLAARMIYHVVGMIK